MDISSALAQFSSKPLLDASRSFLADTLEIPLNPLSNTPFPPERFFRKHYKAERHSALSSLFLVGKLDDSSIAKEIDLFEPKEPTLEEVLEKSKSDHNTIFIIAVELSELSVNRTKLTQVTRDINRMFSHAPVIVLFRHKKEAEPVLSLGVVARRENKRVQSKEVMGKVSLVRDISLSSPHRGHLDILSDLSLASLQKQASSKGRRLNSFRSFQQGLEELFDTELLNQKFYKDLSNWYFWALPQVKFPEGLEPNEEKRHATGLIRLLTRLIFCWFIKEKDLIPNALFSPSKLNEILKDFDPESKEGSQFYHAILQNLFFATLNQQMGKPKTKDAKPYRQFALDEGFSKNRSTYDVNNLYRNEDLFTSAPEEALSYFADIPFLNGGLFECLDRTDEETKKKLYIDGFSRNAKQRPHLPNHLFFSPLIKDVDLSSVYGDKKRKKESVMGLIPILERYKFTIEENTPIEQEIALDPELLGKVFENLLASYNEETKSTARKQTGSFYTPRPIVDYMVDESLKAHLAQALGEKTSLSRSKAEEKLALLFAYTEELPSFKDEEVDIIVQAVHLCKILDPACGSGAYPMGILHKLVFILEKLDPENLRWEQVQIDAAKRIPDREAQKAAIDAIKRAFANEAHDYGRKLYLIENCLYGVDIQPIAIQITKLRFFVSLVCDQKTNKNKAENHGVLPLPNLETKFVSADTLISLPFTEEDLLVNTMIEPIEEELAAAHHDHFSVNTRQKKLSLQKKIKFLRQKLGETLEGSLGKADADKAQKIANWNAFDQHSSADFFDPHWMFGRDVSEGFDIVIGNPPYVQIQKFSKKQKDIWVTQNYETYAATADIYCLFYERGAQLLKQGGSLVYITSNKWMRGGYGKKLRGFLSEKVDTETVLDFGMGLNFDAATTLTNILRFYKQAPDDRILSCYASDTRSAMADPLSYFEEHHVETPNLSEEAWVILSKKRQEIKTRVEAQGLALKEWDISIFRGVLTGYNEAFYLTQEQRDALIVEDPSCEKLICPLLRGRFIDAYGSSWDQTWMISLFPSLKLKGSEIPLPIKRHLESFLPKLNQSGETFINQSGEKEKTRKKTENQWYETQDSISYWREFSKPKIMYPNMTKYLPFFYDNTGFHGNQKCFTISSDKESLLYLTAVLNSHLFRCCFKDNFPELLGNTYEPSKIFFEKIPIRKPTKKDVLLFEPLVPLIQLAKEKDLQTEYTYLEDLIDACVMECYFPEHMAERDLLLHAEILPLVESYNPEATEVDQLSFLSHFYTKASETKGSIRNKLLRISTSSPELLAIIKKEGKV